jgi:hypothetical protein
MLLAVLLAGTVIAPLSTAEAHTARAEQAVSVCDYARLFASLRGQISGFNISFSKPLSNQYDQLKTNLDTVNQIVSTVQGTTPPDGFEQFHADLLRAL